MFMAKDQSYRFLALCWSLIVLMSGIKDGYVEEAMVLVQLQNGAIREVLQKLKTKLKDLSIHTLIFTLPLVK